MVFRIPWGKQKQRKKHERKRNPSPSNLRENGCDTFSMDETQPEQLSFGTPSSVHLLWTSFTILRWTMIHLGRVSRQLVGYRHRLKCFLFFWWWFYFFFVAGEFVDLSKIYVDSWIRPIWKFHISPNEIREKCFLKNMAWTWLKWAPKGCFVLPSGKLTYPNLGTGKRSSSAPWDRIS